MSGEVVGGWTDVQADALLRVLHAVSTHRERMRLFTAIADALHGVLPHDYPFVVLAGPGPDDMQVYYTQPVETLPLLKRSASRLGRLFSHGEAVYVRTREDVRGFPGSLAMLERFGSHSYLALPLRRGDEVFAALLLQANRERAFDDVDAHFAEKLATIVAVALDNCLAYEELAAATARLEEENQCLRDELRAEAGPDHLVSASAEMEEILRQVGLVAPTDATVLIHGETGTGKELIARLVYEKSARADRPLVTVNCAALPASLMESELFGYEPGAFTDANRRRLGRFELADEGTLFLDEVGELGVEAQAKLLRVLQTGELERLGGTETIHVDVRVIAATHRDLRSMAREGRFREDLYYRLAVFPLDIPPLRDRPEDIPPLAAALARESAARIGVRALEIDDRALGALLAYRWPGNARELANVIERAVISSPERLEVEPYLPALPDDGEAGRLEEALGASDGRIEGPEGAAARLGLSPSTLRSRMKRLGVRRP